MHESEILRQLGPISVPQFMRNYWQRKPCLLRAAFADFVAPVDRSRIFELARAPDVESRLITAFNGEWKVQHGPIFRLPSTRRAAWTLLVQGVDLHDESARALLSRFRFIADARLDDLMVSCASDGGSVGPHVDSYDVFLLQASGKRHWSISQQRALQIQTGSPLRQVKGFRASEEYVLEAGDMLYLPPGVAHHGVAIGECLTYSIGFRAPPYQQLLEPWFADYAEDLGLRGRFTDPGVKAVSHPAFLPPAMTREVHGELARHKPTLADTERFLLRHLSEPKPSTVFGASKALSPSTFQRAVRASGLKLDRKTRVLYSRTGIAINGEWIGAARAWLPILKKFADQRELSAALATGLPASSWALLHEWHSAGWVHVDERLHRKLAV